MGKYYNISFKFMQRNISQLASEEIEPYVRKRRNSGSSSERSRKRAENLNEEANNIFVK